jgi:hypothetical protein
MFALFPGSKDHRLTTVADRTNVVFIGKRTVVRFTNEREEVKKSVTTFLPKDLAGIVSEYVMENTPEKPYATVFLDPRTVGETYEWDPGLAQCLAATRGPPEGMTAPAPTMSPPTLLLYPHQATASHLLLSRLAAECTTILDPMDVVHHRVENNVWFTREGYVAHKKEYPGPPPLSRTLDFHGGCFLWEKTGMGKTRTTLETLKQRHGSAPPPTTSGRHSVSTMAIVTPPNTMYTWRREIKLVVPEWTVVFVDDARSLKGLAKKLKETQPHLVVFSMTFFSGNVTLNSSTLEGWTLDHQVLWTTIWHTVVIDEAHLLCDTSPDVLSRNAWLIKAMVPGHQHILVSANPGFHKSVHLDTYAYLLDTTHDGQYLYPKNHTVQNHLLPRPNRGFHLVDETRTKVHTVFLRDCVVTTGFQIPTMTLDRTITYHESRLFLGVPQWGDRILLMLTTKDMKDDFVDRCKTLTQIQRRTYYGLTQEAVISLVKEDQDCQEKLGTIVGTKEDVETMNKVHVHSGLVPVQMAIMRILVHLVQNVKANVLIYTNCYTSVFWTNLTTVMKGMHNVNIRGTKDRKRQRADSLVGKVSFTPPEGKSLGFVTHLLVLHEPPTAKFLERTTYLGRVDPLVIVKLNSIQK